MTDAPTKKATCLRCGGPFTNPYENMAADPGCHAAVENCIHHQAAQIAEHQTALRDVQQNFQAVWVSVDKQSAQIAELKAMVHEIEGITRRLASKYDDIVPSQAERPKPGESRLCQEAGDGARCTTPEHWSAPSAAKPEPPECDCYGIVRHADDCPKARAAEAKPVPERWRCFCGLAFSKPTDHKDTSGEWHLATAPGWTLETAKPETQERRTIRVINTSERVVSGLLANLISGDGIRDGEGVTVVEQLPGEWLVDANAGENWKVRYESLRASVKYIMRDAANKAPEQITPHYVTRIVQHLQRALLPEPAAGEKREGRA